MIAKDEEKRIANHTRMVLPIPELLVAVVPQEEQVKLVVALMKHPVGVRMMVQNRPGNNGIVLKEHLPQAPAKMLLRNGYRHIGEGNEN